MLITASVPVESYSFSVRSPTQGIPTAMCTHTEITKQCSIGPTLPSITTARHATPHSSESIIHIFFTTEDIHTRGRLYIPYIIPLNKTLGKDIYMDTTDKLQAGLSKQRAELLQDAGYQVLCTQGQSPEVMFISCCDARVDPALLFDSKLGDLFVFRNIANLVQPYPQDTSLAATISFATQHVGVTDIIILGHSQCAGIKGMCNHHNFSGPLKAYLSAASDALKQPVTMDNTIHGHDRQAMQALAYSWNNLSQYPEIKRSNTCRIHAWFYMLESASLYCYDSTQQCFHAM